VPLPPREIALIFDLDNTLIDSHIDFLGLRHRLIDLLYKEGRLTQTRDELVRLALPELVSLGSQLKPELADQMWEVIGQAERAGLENATVIHSAPEVIETLTKRGYQLALLTNNARVGVQERLESLELGRHFKVIATRDEVPSLKPSPHGIVYILGHLSQVARTYVVGDAWIDAQAAHEAGARFIGFGNKEKAVRDRALPIWKWIIDLRELLAVDYGR
jgi:phosphoglycolate phosphatase